MEDTQEQPINRHDILEKEKERNKADHLASWQFKPGQSGNPGGRPKGISLKVWAQNYLATLTEEERLDFLKGMGKSDIWRMAEGNPANNTDITSGGKPIIQLAQDIIEKNDIDTKPESNS